MGDSQRASMTVVQVIQESHVVLTPLRVDKIVVLVKSLISVAGPDTCDVRRRTQRLGRRRSGQH